MGKKKNDETPGGGIAADLKRILKHEIERLPQLLEQLTPDQRAKTILELLQYVAPKYDKVKAEDLAGWDIGADWI